MWARLAGRGACLFGYVGWWMCFINLHAGRGRRGRSGGKTGLNFAQAGHQFDEIARAIAAVELFGENPVPAILHRAI